MALTNPLACLLASCDNEPGPGSLFCCSAHDEKFQSFSLDKLRDIAVPCTEGPQQTGFGVMPASARVPVDANRREVAVKRRKRPVVPPPKKRIQRRRKQTVFFGREFR